MSSEWQRLAPMAVIYFAVRSLVQLLNAYAVVLAAVIAASQLGFSSLQLAVYIALALLAVFLCATLYYLNFAYIQEADCFLIRHGILSKNRIELPFNKIQNVSLKQPFYYRPFNLVVLSMDGAGSNNSEVALAALSRDRAESIQRAIAQFNDVPGHVRDNGFALTEEGQPALAKPASEPLLTRSTFDVVLHGLAHNRAWFLVALAAPVLMQLDRPLERLVEFSGFELNSLAGHASTAMLVGLAVLAGVALLCLLSLLSVVGAMLALADLKLFYEAGTYKRTSGLFNRYEIQVKKSRVQTLRYQQNWLDLWARRLNMVFEPFASAGFEQGQSAMQKILLPSISHAQFCEISKHLYPDFNFDDLRFCQVDKLYLIRAMLSIVAPATAASAFIAGVSDTGQLLLPLAVAIVLTGAMVLRWRRLGIASTGIYVVVRRGFIGREYFCFAAHKAQQVRIYQSVFLRRRGLATIEVVLASRSLRVPLLPEARTLEIAQQCLQASEQSKRSWM